MKETFAASPVWIAMQAFTVAIIPLAAAGAVLQWGRPKRAR